MGFKAPIGSLDIPHPRTVRDILYRSLATNVFAVIAYAHLLYLLKFRKPHGFASLHPLLIPVFMLLPELVLLQFAFAALPFFVASPYRSRVVERFRALPIELGIVDGNSSGYKGGLGRLILHAAFAICNAIPLGAVIVAYHERWNMSWHGINHASTLGLDHRNGLAAVGGLASVFISIGVILALAFVVRAGIQMREPNPPPGDNSIAMSETNGSATGAAVESYSYGEEPHTTPLGGLVKRVAVRLTHKVSQIDWSSVSEVVYTSLLHQFILKSTLHPVTLWLLVEVWYPWPFSIVISYILWKRYGVDKMTIILAHIMFFVALNALLPLGWDLRELWEVCCDNDLKPYNFRWQVKDLFSAKNPKDD